MEISKGLAKALFLHLKNQPACICLNDKAQGGIAMPYDNSTQPFFVISQNITVIAEKPSSKQILQISSEPFLTKAFIKDDKIIFKGHVLIKIKHLPSDTNNKKIMAEREFKIYYTQALFYPHEQYSSINLKVYKEFEKFSPIDEQSLRAYFILRLETSATKKGLV